MLRSIEVNLNSAPDHMTMTLPSPSLYSPRVLSSVPTPQGETVHLTPPAPLFLLLLFLFLPLPLLFLLLLLLLLLLFSPPGKTTRS